MDSKSWKEKLKGYQVMNGNCSKQNFLTRIGSNIMKNYDLHGEGK